MVSPLSRLPSALGTANWSRLSGEDLERQYSAFRSGGGSVFDTAHCYAFWLGELGTPERLLGGLVRKLETDRDAVFVVTKGGHPGSEPGYPRPDKYLAPERLGQDVSESLERLNIGPIDLYLLHRDDTRVPAAEILDSLQPFLSRGDLRAVGVSNWTLARIVEANDAARKNGWTPFTTHQVCYSLASANPTLPFPTPTAEDVAWYAKEQFHLMAFSATANGYFEGASSADYDNPVSRRRRERARELGKKYNATPTQVALAWLLARPFPVWPTFSTSRLDHLREALDVGRVRLTREDLEMLGA